MPDGPEFDDLDFDSLITIRWDKGEGQPVYDFGEMSAFSAAEILKIVRKDIRARYYPDPRHIDDPVDEEESDG